MSAGSYGCRAATTRLTLPVATLLPLGAAATAPAAGPAPYWVNPDGKAHRAAEARRAAGRVGEAELVGRIAARPQGEWVGEGRGGRRRRRGR